MILRNFGIKVFYRSRRLWVVAACVLVGWIGTIAQAAPCSAKAADKLNNAVVDDAALKKPLKASLQNLDALTEAVAKAYSRLTLDCDTPNPNHAKVSHFILATSRKDFTNLSWLNALKEWLVSLDFHRVNGELKPGLVSQVDTPGSTSHIKRIASVQFYIAEMYEAVSTRRLIAAGRITSNQVQDFGRKFDLSGVPNHVSQTIEADAFAIKSPGEKILIDQKHTMGDETHITMDKLRDAEAVLSLTPEQREAFFDRVWFPVNQAPAPGIVTEIGNINQRLNLLHGGNPVQYIEVILDPVPFPP